MSPAERKEKSNPDALHETVDAVKKKIPAAFIKHTQFLRTLVVPLSPKLNERRTA